MSDLISGPQAPSLIRPRTLWPDLARVVFFLFVLVLAESLARRLLVSYVLSPRAVWLELPARFGRCASLAVALSALTLSWRAASARWTGLGAFAEQALAWICTPARVARALVVFSVVLVGLRYSALRRGQLPWHQAAVLATALLCLWLLFEGGARLLRGPRSWPRDVSRLGRVVWIILLCWLALVIFPRLFITERWLANLVTSLLLLGLYWLSEPWLTPRHPALACIGALLGVAALATGAVIDHDHRPLRRYGMPLCPFSHLGLHASLAITDLDGDGSSGLLGLDCAEGDPRRGSRQTDAPDDGIDQNCSGTGSSSSVSAMRRKSGVRAPWPAADVPVRKPTVVFISIDSLRADALDESQPGFAMPQTAAWAGRCVRLRQARSNSNFTALAMLAMRTGVHPRHVRFGRRTLFSKGDEARKISPRPPTLAWAFSKAGYWSHGFMPAELMEPAFTANFSMLTQISMENRDLLGLLAKVKAAMVQAPPGLPGYYFLHLMDVHAPYHGGGRDRASYLASVRAVDAELAGFLRGLDEDTFVVVTADHGEAFGEHGVYNHGNSLFDEELRVPLLLCPPADRPLGPPRWVETPVGAVDIGPTVLDLIRAQVDYPLHGESLVHHLRTGAPLRHPSVFFESWRDARHLQGMLSGCDKVIRDLDDQWEALFDVCTDPGETENLSRPAPDRFRRLRYGLLEVLDEDLDAFRTWRDGGQEFLPGRVPRGPSE